VIKVCLRELLLNEGLMVMPGVEALGMQSAVARAAGKAANTKAMDEGSPSLTLQQGLALQQELLDGFEERSFQQKLRSLFLLI
jgi:hypothetical protein